jgi:3',5'-cyclic AMP phosphodiesterase CpdA
MIIAQITDLHIVARDHLCYGEIPPNAQLPEAVAHINRLVAQPDAVIASGDANQRSVAHSIKVGSKKRN